MRRRLSAIVACLVPMLACGVSSRLFAQAAPDAAACPVTLPDPARPRAAVGNYGNAALSTVLYPDGVVTFKPSGPGFVLADGALSMKFWWWRHAAGNLRLEGRRIDGEAPPMRAYIPDGYRDSFQATGLIFPTPGCWEVTGRLGDASLMFVTRVVKIGDGPARADDVR